MSSSLQLKSFIELSLQSFRDLTLAWSATIFGTTGPSQITCGVEDDPSMARFFLNPMVDDKCAATDLFLISVLAVIVHAISWWGRWFVWEPIAELRMRGIEKRFDPMTSKRFGKTLTSIFFHSISAIMVFKILTKTEWIFISKQWHPENYSHLGGQVEADFKFFYLFYMARYCSDSISMFFEERKKDFGQMLTHHMVTIGLVFASSGGGYHRYGGAIMFIFDWADIPLQTAKAFKYLSLSSNDGFQYIANRLFEIFAVVFTITRSFMYNYIVYAAYRDDKKFAWRPAFAKILLLLLACLQTFWLRLLYKAVLKQRANGGNVEDIREDKKKAL